MKENLTQEHDLQQNCYRSAVEILKKSAIPEGFGASTDDPHYGGLWARDACYSIPGALLTGDPGLIEASKNTLRTLATTQGRYGQVIDAYWPSTEHRDWGEAGSTDTSSLFIVAAGEYVKTTHDVEFLKEIWPSLQKAFTWLTFQDANNFGLIDSPAASGWMDSTLVKRGKVLDNNILFYKAALSLVEMGETLGEPQAFDFVELRNKINTLFWPTGKEDYASLLGHVPMSRRAPRIFPHVTSVEAYEHAAREDREYYLSHVEYGTFADTCDVLANVLAIVYEVADTEKADKILGYLSSHNASDPYPIKCWIDPVQEGEDAWNMLSVTAEKFQDPRWKNPPNEYHNGAIWPFIGGIYIEALCKMGRYDQAEKELTKLAKANEQSNFNEWLHAKTGAAGGSASQTWSAARYITAYKAVEEGKRHV